MEAYILRDKGVYNAISNRLRKHLTENDISHMQAIMVTTQAVDVIMRYMYQAQSLENFYKFLDELESPELKAMIYATLSLAQEMQEEMKECKKNGLIK